VGSLVLACLRSDAEKKRIGALARGKINLGTEGRGRGIFAREEGGKGRHTEIG
jgi:hypothetical protein